MRDLARQPLRRELVIDRRIERDEQVAVLRDLVPGLGARGELELVGLEHHAADGHGPVVAPDATRPDRAPAMIAPTALPCRGPTTGSSG